jgi:hypothetical protein|tara:strand:+ start:291 stop:536 length:246 start_codon:yes stop_codon:yes gene_type:complete
MTYKSTMLLNLRMSNKIKSRHQEGVWNNPVKMQMIVDNKGWKPTVLGQVSPSIQPLVSNHFTLDANRPLKTSSLLDSDQLS